MGRGALLTTITNGSNQYGPLQPNLHHDLFEGYTVFVGPNNAGKSALMQMMFGRLMNEGTFGAERLALIPADRQGLASSHETGGTTLANFNNDLFGQLSSQPLSYDQSRQANNSLGRLLLTHTDMYPQLGRAGEILEQLGLPRLQIKAGQTLHFDEVQGFLQGSGLRSLYPIVAALTDPQLRAIFIDEPEISLEPTLQKALRDLLVEHASGGRTIVVATHSHLFLDRQTVEANYIVGRDGNNHVVIRPLATEPELLDVAFGLLGNSTEDLFFPRNYLVVEGASDQVIAERVLELLDVPRGLIKVLSASGITEIQSAIFAVERALLPMIVSDSPYAGRVVALIDQPQDSERVRVEKLRTILSNRLIELPAPSLESYMPEAIYQSAGLEKDVQLGRVAAASSYAEERDVKREISTALSAALTIELLDEIPEVRQAVEMSLNSPEADKPAQADGTAQDAA
jgi:energy-coupling factor transporter ATP-binding protein EcfA2